MPTFFLFTLFSVLQKSQLAEGLDCNKKSGIQVLSFWALLVHQKHKNRHSQQGDIILKFGRVLAGTICGVFKRIILKVRSIFFHGHILWYTYKIVQSHYKTMQYENVCTKWIHKILGSRIKPLNLGLNPVP